MRDTPQATPIRRSGDLHHCTALRTQRTSVLSNRRSVDGFAVLKYHQSPIREKSSEHQLTLRLNFTVNLEHVPLLQLQRDWCDGPRGAERFKEYIRTLRGSTFDDMELPLSAFNPMAKQHVPDLLDEYIALGAEDAAAETVEQQHSNAALQTDGSFRVALVLADDAHGGWTNRIATEFEHRFNDRAYHRRGWACGLLWTSEPASLDSVRETVTSAIWRAHVVQQHGWPRTLAGMMHQAGCVATNAGCAVKPEYDLEELEYTRTVIEPFRESEKKSDQIACLFGDAAAKELGYQPLGLSPRAGFALAGYEALHTENRISAPPE